MEKKIRCKVAFKYQYKHELYELLQNNAYKFDKEQVGKILDWIEEKKYLVSFEANEELADQIIAGKKKEWLSSILNNKDVRINKEYEKHQSINDVKLRSPWF